jgi:hypothetical protein
MLNGISAVLDQMPFSNDAAFLSFDLDIACTRPPARAPDTPLSMR